MTEVEMKSKKIHSSVSSLIYRRIHMVAIKKEKDATAQLSSAATMLLDHRNVHENHVFRHLVNPNRQIKRIYELQSKI